MAGPTLASQRTFPQQEIEIVRSAPVSISDLPLKPRVSSIGATTTGRTALACAKVFPVAPVYRHVLQFRNGMFLAGYSDDGISIVSNINDAKLFHPHAVDDAADLFCARVIVVLANANGTGVRLTLINPNFAPLTQKLDGRPSEPYDTSVTEVSALPKAGELNEEAKASVKENTEQSEKVAEPNGVKSERASTGAENGGRELTQKGIPKTRTGDGADGWAKPAPLPSTLQGKKLFLEFISAYLGVEVFGVQAGYKNIPDQFLFRGPNGTSMAIFVGVMLLDRKSALALIHKRIDEKQFAFEVSR